MITIISEMPRILDDDTMSYMALLNFLWYQSAGYNNMLKHVIRELIRNRIRLSVGHCKGIVQTSLYNTFERDDPDDNAD